MQIYNVPLSKDQPIIFDGGANAGLFTLWADQKWKNARIYAYEPVGYNYEVAKSNIEKYAPSQIVYKKALSTCVGKAALNIGVHPGSSSLIKTEIGSSQQQEVETTTLTEEMDLHDIHYVDLLKLDVEGSEIDILRGANLARVGFIAMEYHYRDGGKLIDDILERTHKKILHKEGIMWYQPIGSYSKTFA